MQISNFISYKNYVDYKDCINLCVKQFNNLTDLNFKPYDITMDLAECIHLFESYNNIYNFYNYINCIRKLNKLKLKVDMTSEIIDDLVHNLKCLCVLAR